MTKLVIVLVAILAIFTFIRDFGASPASASAAIHAETQAVSTP